MRAQLSGRMSATSRRLREDWGPRQGTHGRGKKSSASAIFSLTGEMVRVPGLSGRNSSSTRDSMRAAAMPAPENLESHGRRRVEQQGFETV